MCLNPSDNQGVRDLLAPALMIQGDNTAAQRLLDRYSTDITAAPAFNSALVAFRRRGDTKVARKRLEEAQRRNSHVAPMLLDSSRFPDEIPYDCTLGSVEEAAYYVMTAGEAWTASPGALEWLAAVLGQDQR